LRRERRALFLARDAINAKAHGGKVEVASSAAQTSFTFTTMPRGALLDQPVPAASRHLDSRINP